MDLHFRRKLVALLAGPLLLTAPMAPAVDAVTFKDCADITAQYHPVWYVYRNVTNYYAGQGEVVIRQLKGCTNASGSLQNDSSQVWPVNLERTTGTVDFKQLGYLTAPGGGGSGLDMDWYATCCIGYTENVTVVNIAPVYPILANNTRFSVYRILIGSTYYWRMKIDDLDHPGHYGWRDLQQAATSFEKSYYALEEHSRQSQFGSNSGTSPVQIRGLSYRLSNGGAWNYLEGTSNARWDGAFGLGTPLCWIYTANTYSGPFSSIQTSVNGFTSNTC